MMEITMNNETDRNLIGKYEEADIRSRNSTQNPFSKSPGWIILGRNS
jgi:hypothetical protein